MEYEISIHRLIITYTIAIKNTTPCMIGVSLAVMASATILPSPCLANTVSMTTVPPKNHPVARQSLSLQVLMHF